MLDIDQLLATCTQAARTAGGDRFTNGQHRSAQAAVEETAAETVHNVREWFREMFEAGWQS
ncbi:MAG: hypothetical protein ACFB4I_06885 [Cyanophyceae cyanobacterium]